MASKASRDKRLAAADKKIASAQERLSKADAIRDEANAVIKKAEADKVWLEAMPVDDDLEGNEESELTTVPMVPITQAGEDIDAEPQRRRWHAAVAAPTTAVTTNN